MRLVVALCVVLLLPLPWRYVMTAPIGLALRLDGRLEVAGDAVNPPGEWSWLAAAGRPQLLGEAVYARVAGTGAPPLDVWSGAAVRRPALSEPAAAAVGLRHAGRDVPLGLLVEARDPLLAGYPDVALIAAIDGITLTDRQAWEQASSRWAAAAGGAAGVQDASPTADAVSFRLADGRELTAPGPGLPYAVVHTLDLAPPDLRARISFRFAQVLPWELMRGLALGRSHGMMIAMLTYAEASGEDLAQGRHIAGTGGILGDGTVTAIGNLDAKARAANRAGADVLLVPASQAHTLNGIALPGTTLVPVQSLQEAIDWLSAPGA